MKTLPEPNFVQKPLEYHFIMPGNKVFLWKSNLFKKSKNFYPVNLVVPQTWDNNSLENIKVSNFNRMIGE